MFDIIDAPCNQEVCRTSSSTLLTC